MITKSHLFRATHAIAMATALLLSLIASRSMAQSIPQTALYISDGSGHLTALTAPSGPSTIIFPAGGGTLLTTTTGLANPMTTLGDMIYGIASGVATRLPGNSTGSTKKFLTSTAALGVAAAPAWGTIAGADVPVFLASGASHATGAVPDPGSTSGTTRFLREDATWAAPSGGSAMMITGSCDVTFSGNAVQYSYPLGRVGTVSTSPAISQNNVMVVNRSGTIKNLRVVISSPTGDNTKTYTFTIYAGTLGTTSTGVTVTFPDGIASTEIDNTHTYNVSAGELISIKYSGSGSPGGTNAIWAFDIQ